MIVRVRVSRAWTLAAAGLAVIAVAAAAVVLVPRWLQPRPYAVPAAEVPLAEARKIRAAICYVTPDGTRLQSVEREVAYGEGTVEQAKRILEVQLGPPPEGQTSAIPPGTALRALFLLPGGQAYVDLTREVSARHPGGTLNELLTVYTIVEALTANLPVIRSVHLLVDGHEVETLAGHVDLRRPLSRSSQWMTHDTH